MIKKMTCLIIVIAMLFSNVLAFENNINCDSNIETSYSSQIANDFSISIRDNGNLREVRVTDLSNGEKSYAVYEKSTDKLTLNGENVDFVKVDDDINNYTLYANQSRELLKQRTIKINVAGMSASAIVAAIVAAAGGGIVISVLTTMITAALSDNLIQDYVSVKVYSYWDPSTINQSRPKFWREFEIYAGPNCDKFLGRI